MEDLVGAIAEAIAKMEGFYLSNSPAKRNNNPGNLRSWGSRPIRSGFAYFNTPQEGWSALRRQVTILIDMNLTLYEFFGGKEGVYAGYAPAADSNKPMEYADFVAEQVGISPDVPLQEVGSSDSRAKNILGMLAVLFFVVILLKARE